MRGRPSTEDSAPRRIVLPTQRASKRKPKRKKAGEPKVPAELLARAQWVAWRIESRDGESAKVPYSPISGRRASTSNPSTWGRYEQALAFCAERGMDGVGYVFSAEDPYAGIDLDKCRDPQTSAIEQWAQEIITALNSYTEISPSGKGMHIIVRGALPPGGRRARLIELYDSGRYFTMTGVRLSGTPRSIEPRQAELDALHERLWPVPPEAPGTWPLGARIAAPRLTDEEVLEKALGARNGEKFARLWTGDTSNYNDDHSAADMALCSLLAFWTQDPEQIDRLFRQSGLIRPKWDEKRGAQTYGEGTIEKVLARVTSTCGTLNQDGRLLQRSEGVMAKRYSTRREFLATARGATFEVLANESPSTEEGEDTSERVADDIPDPACMTDVNKVLTETFPHLRLAINAGLAAAATLLIKENPAPTALFFVGRSGAGKSTIVELFVGHPMVFHTDSYTPAAWGSQAANMTQEQLDKANLLKKVRHKILAIPELSATFRGEYRTLVDQFKVITRVLDGKGYRTEGGVQGSQGEYGDFLFTWLAGTTPFDDVVYDIMAQLGSRIFFYFVCGSPSLSKENRVKARFEDPYPDKVRRARAAVQAALDALFNGQIRRISWPASRDSAEAYRAIVECADLVSAARARAISRDSEDLVEEDTRRAETILGNIARGHAILHGRTVLLPEDLGIMARVAIGTMPWPFPLAMEALLSKEPLSAEDFRKAIEVKSKDTASKYRRAMEAHEVIKDSRDKISLSDRFAWFKSLEFKEIWSKVQ
jgi:putative DNA primase/helicase